MLKSMTATQEETLYSSASTAMAAGNWDNAILYLRQLVALLAITRNVTRGYSGNAQQSISYNGINLYELIAQCERERTAATIDSLNAGPLIRVRQRYVKATDT